MYIHMYTLNLIYIRTYVALLKFKLISIVTLLLEHFKHVQTHLWRDSSPSFSEATTDVQFK